MKSRLTPRKIVETLEGHRNEIRKFGVRRIGLFGSFAKGTQKKGSDLDFLVSFGKPTFDNYMELKFLLERIFSKKVDLVTEENLKPALRHVKEEAVYAKRI